MANIPQPISGAGGGGSRGPGEILLMGLAQQLLGGLLQEGMGRVFPQPVTPPSPQQQALNAEQQYSQQELLRMAPGLGNAATSTASVNPTVMRGLAGGPATAPLYLKQAQDEAIATAAAKEHRRLIKKFRASPNVTEEDVQALELSLGMIQQGAASGDAFAAASKINPSLKTQLDDIRTGMTLDILKSPEFNAMSIDQLMNTASEQLPVALAIESMGLGTLFSNFRSDQAIAARQLRQTAVDLRAQYGLTNISTRGLINFLQTGQAATDADAAALAPYLDQLDTTRRVAKLGLMTRIFDSPAAKVLTTFVDTAIKEGNDEAALDAYNRLRSMASRMPGMDAASIDIVFPPAVKLTSGGWNIPFTGMRFGEATNFSFLTQPEELGSLELLRRSAGDPVQAIKEAAELLRTLPPVEAERRSTVQRTIDFLRLIAKGDVSFQ